MAADSSPKILEGVFAVTKPPSRSSAQVLRDLQLKFRDSKTFAPLLDETTRQKAEEQRYGNKRRKYTDPDATFKMGHGGTLDPLATGVLIVGIGRGTKYLNRFLDCTKTYETVVLFGKSTDTYDVAGKIVADAPSDHITKDVVEQKLGSFRGEIRQVPPIYSAIKINGMKAYEYARTDQPLPRELESRAMTVSECSLLEWYPTGSHNYRWPAEEATVEDKVTAKKLIDVAEHTKHKIESSTDGNEEASTNHKVEKDEKAPDGQHEGETTASEKTLTGWQPIPSSPIPFTETRQEPSKSIFEINAMAPAAKALLHTHELPDQSLHPATAPAARIRLTTSSGFYVRSFAHDLGIACKSYGIMSELLRSRQGDFTTVNPPPENLFPVLTYQDLEEGEDVWGPKITTTLERWLDANPDSSSAEQKDDNSGSRRRDHKWGQGHRKGGYRPRRGNSQRQRYE